MALPIKLKDIIEGMDPESMAASCPPPGHSCWHCARGLGSAWTTLHIRYAQDVATLLGIPDGITQAALLPVAYYTGDDFKPARRVPARERTYWNGWDKTR